MIFWFLYCHKIALKGAKKALWNASLHLHSVIFLSYINAIPAFQQNLILGNC